MISLSTFAWDQERGGEERRGRRGEEGEEGEEGEDGRSRQYGLRQVKGQA